VLAVQAEGPEYVSAQVGNVTLWHPATIVDGQLLIVEIAPAPGCDTPVVVWQGQSYKTLPVGEHVRALMPVALGTSPGQKDLQVICGTETARFPLLVTAGNYPESQLTVDPKFVHAPPERATVEGANIHQALSQSDPVPFWREAFLRPTDGVITSIFGGRRTFNGTLASRHMGLDFDGSLGTPVRAANRGRVVLAAGDYYFVGNAVFVDHGAGLFTMYFHMSALAVKRATWWKKVSSSARSARPAVPPGRTCISVPKFRVSISIPKVCSIMSRRGCWRRGPWPRCAGEGLGRPEFNHLRRLVRARIAC